MTILEPPDHRRCTRCDREEVWSDELETWVAADSNDGPLGNAHCVHTWDITGNYNPINR